MFVVWGHRIKLFKTGIVSDFCTICRCIRAHQISELRKIDHVYFLSVPFSRGSIVSHEIKCMECGTCLQTELTRYKCVVPFKATEQFRPERSLQELINQTYPEINSVYFQRLKLEQDLRLSPSQIPAATRLDLLKEPFFTLEWMTRRVVEARKLDLRFFAWIIGSVIVVWAISFGVLKYGLLGDDPAVLPMVIVAAAGIVLIAGLIQYSLLLRRQLNMQCLARVIRALKPIHPTEEELKKLHSSLQGQVTLCKHVSSTKLIVAMKG